MAMAACIARGNAVAQIGVHSGSRKELGRADHWSATPKYFANAQRSASKHAACSKESQKIRLCSAFLDSGVKHHSASARAFSRRARSVNDVRCQAAAGGEEPLPVEVPKVEVPKVETKTESELTKTLQLGALFGGWYLFNIYFNIYNKQVLKVFKFPITCTQVQLGVGVVWALLMWATGLHKKPKVSKEQLIAIVPLALVHALGNLFTNLSLGKVAVSFTHTIKAMEPFFSVLLSSLFLGDKPQLPIILALLPIVAGVGLASATEASFNWAGFLSAMASNLTFQSRNVLSKKLMVKKEGSLDNINLFSIITILAFFLLLPLTLVTEGVKLTPAYLEAAGLDVKQVMTRIFLAGFCFHAYQQVSYMILSKVTPVTHSVGNCVKRVVVIVTSVLFFKTPVSAINAIGTAIALSGVFAYSRVKATLTKKEKTA